MKDMRTLDHLRVPANKMPPILLHVDDMDLRTDGLFDLPSALDQKPMRVQTSSGCGWEHISVSRADRIPHWIEMQQVKLTFFHDDEWVLQFHPSEADYITGRWPGGRSLNVLHLWRPLDQPIPKPPRWMVGANSRTEWERHTREAEAALERRP